MRDICRNYIASTERRWGYKPLGEAPTASIVGGCSVRFLSLTDIETEEASAPDLSSKKCGFRTLFDELFGILTQVALNLAGGGIEELSSGVGVHENL